MHIENEKEQKLKRDIVFDYCKARPNSALAKINEELGIDIAVKILDLFQGKSASFPTSDSLKRAVMPKLIQRHLFMVNPDSELFVKRVKQLSKLYKLSKRAIIEMNKKGIYTR